MRFIYAAIAIMSIAALVSLIAGPQVFEPRPRAATVRHAAAEAVPDELLDIEAARHALAQEDLLPARNFLLAALNESRTGP